jgi:hypothetical protein
MNIYKVYSLSSLSHCYFVRASYSHEAVNKVGPDAGSWEIPTSLPEWALGIGCKPSKAVYDRMLKAYIPSLIWHTTKPYETNPLSGL